MDHLWIFILYLFFFPLAFGHQVLSLGIPGSFWMNAGQYMWNSIEGLDDIIIFWIIILIFFWLVVTVRKDHLNLFRDWDSLRLVSHFVRTGLFLDVVLLFLSSPVGFPVEGFSYFPRPFFICVNLLKVPLSFVTS